MDENEQLSDGLQATEEQGESTRWSGGIAAAQETPKEELARLQTELAALMTRQEVLLFLATSPHSTYRPEALSNLKWLKEAIAAFEARIQKMEFPRSN